MKKMKKNGRKSIMAILFAAIILCSCLATISSASAITYTTTYANTADAPNFGTMIDPSTYYLGDTGSGAAAKPGGNALDTLRVYIWDYKTEFKMMKWDMSAATNFVRVYPDVEHNGAYDWDYLQWSLWGSNTGAEDPSAWTLLWDPISTSGSNVNDFMVTNWNGIEPTTIYRYGSSLGADAWDDAFTIDFNLPTSYRYFGIRVSTLAFNAGHPDPEIDAVCTEDPWQEINAELDALITNVSAAAMPDIIKQRLVDKLVYAKELKDNAKEECLAGNFDAATKKLGVAKNQVESFASMVEITRRITPEDKASFLADANEIIGKIEKLIGHIETEHSC